MNESSCFLPPASCLLPPASYFLFFFPIELNCVIMSLFEVTDRFSDVSIYPNTPVDNRTDENFMEMPVMKTSPSPQFNSWQEHILDRLSAGIGPESVDSDLGQTGGKVLDGKYRIEELRGQGGMGAVYRATHLGTGRTVAVKILAPDLAGESNFVERFRREAKTVGLLHHPNIVNIMDFGLTSATSQTVAYLVMEYLEGRTLWVSEK
jgi:Protein kinase domain